MTRRSVWQIFWPIALAAAVAGCSIPSWMPLVGTDKTKKPPGAAAVVRPPDSPPPAAEPPTEVRPMRLPESRDVMDRVICGVNNDAITLYELEEAEIRYIHETKETPPVGEARRALRERLLTGIIEGRIQLQQAEREKIVVEDAEMTEQLTEIMQKLNAKTPQEF